MAAGTALKLDIRIHDLIDPRKYYDFLREKRWAPWHMLPGMHFKSCQKERAQGIGSLLPEIQVQQLRVSLQ